MADKREDDCILVVQGTIVDDFAELAESVSALIERLPRNDIDRVSIEVPLGRLRETMEGACDLEERLDIKATGWTYWSTLQIKAHYAKLLSLVEEYAEAKSEKKDAEDGEGKKAALAKRKKASEALLKYVGEV